MNFEYKSHIYLIGEAETDLPDAETILRDDLNISMGGMRERALD